jgi:hypothetical protein
MWVNKGLIVINWERFLLEEYAKCISYLGECVQLIHPSVVNYGLWLIKLKTVK